MLEFTEQNFENEVLNSNIPVLVDFFAEWCGPCRMLAPVLAKVSEELQGKIKIGKVNSDNSSELAMKYQISSIPCMILFINGTENERIVGYRSENELKNWLNNKISQNTK